MVGCWSPDDVKEEIPLFYDDFDPLKEWLVDPDRAQLQIPSDFSNSCLDSHGLQFSGVEIEQKNKILESSIDVKIEKVSLVETSGGCQVGEVGMEENEGGNDEEMKLEALKSDLPSVGGTCEGESDEEGGSPSVAAEFDSGDSSSDEFSSDESPSVAESLSSSEDEDSGGMERRDEDGEFEEGEVREFDAHGIDFLLDEEEKGPKGPIRSKHEVEDLSPVPKVEVSLQPHHQILPVGVILSIMNNKVIVEGSVRHNPLDEGSILWVTDTRLPLGLVDEIFGPVKNPYYVVRYNTEEEVPAGVGVGISISFVAEFASQILNDKDLYKKGYDASGDNDDEIDNEVEFSDDEKEAEYRRSMRQGKRGTDALKGMNMKKEARVDRTTFMGRRVQHKVTQKQQTCTPLSMNQPHPTALVRPQLAPFLRQSGIGPGSRNSSSGATNTVSVAPPTMPQFPHAMQAVNFLGNQSQQLSTQHQDASWSPGFLPQLQNIGLQGDLSMQLQSQSQILNNLFNLLTFQQQLQQFIPHQGSTFPWVGAAPSQQPLGQNNFAPSLFGNGFINVPGTSSMCNEQIQGQAPLPGTSDMSNGQIQGQAPLRGTSGPGNGQIQARGPLPGTSGLGNEQIQGYAPLPGTSGPGNGQIQARAPLAGTSGLGNAQIQGQAPLPGTSGPGNGQIQGRAPLAGTSGLGNAQIQGQAPLPGTSGPGNGQIQGRAPLPGTSGLGNGQIQGQAPLSFGPSMQFNAGSSSSLHFNGGNLRSHGMRPYHRGGGRFFGRGGRQPNR